MKIVVRSSSLLFFFVNLLFGLPVRRRLGIGLESRRPVREDTLPIAIEKPEAHFGQAWPPLSGGYGQRIKSQAQRTSRRTAPQN
jgi:hypothetical protein